MNNELYQQVGIPPQGAQVVPVYQGLKPKKPVIDNGKFLFQFFFLNEGFETPCVRMKLLGSLSKNLPRKSVMPKGQTTLLQKQNDWKFRLLQNEVESRLPVVARSSKRSSLTSSIMIHRYIVPIELHGLSLHYGPAFFSGSIYVELKKKQTNKKAIKKPWF